MSARPLPGLGAAKRNAAAPGATPPKRQGKTAGSKAKPPNTGLDIKTEHGAHKATRVTRDGIGVHCAGELRSPLSVKQHPDNRHTHPAAQLKALANLIKWHGWRSPIIVNKANDYIVAGNGRHATATLMGWKEVPVEAQFFTPEQERAHLIADNQIAEWAEYDYEGLAKTIREIQDAGGVLDMTGIEPGELGVLLAGVGKPSGGSGGSRPRTQMKSVKGTPEQIATVIRAVARKRTEASSPDMSDGRALELICQSYLDGQRAPA